MTMDAELNEYEKRAAVYTTKLISLMRDLDWYKLQIELRKGEVEVEVQVLQHYYSPRPYVAAKFDEPVETF